MLYNYYRLKNKYNKLNNNLHNTRKGVNDSNVFEIGKLGRRKKLKTKVIHEEYQGQTFNTKTTKQNTLTITQAQSALSVKEVDSRFLKIAYP